MCITEHALGLRTIPFRAADTDLSKKKLIRALALCQYFAKSPYSSYPQCLFALPGSFSSADSCLGACLQLSQKGDSKAEIPDLSIAAVHF